MAYAELFLEFSAAYQDPNKSNTDYNTLLKSRLDRVTAHERHPGCRLKLYDRYWKRLVVT